MKAIVQEQYGSPDVLRLADVDLPVPAGNQVLVRVHAAAVNARDWHIMRGDPYLARLSPDFGLRRPKVPVRGSDFAGRVEAVGPEVTGFRVGDEVFGEHDGAFAEYVCAPADRVERKPANLTFEQAAAIPLAANTALIGLRDVAKVQPGQHVVVNGASGGVGTFAVQLAAALGARVTGVCRTRNVELVRSLGAHEVVDYTRDDFTRTGRPADAVLDLVGNRSLRDLRRALAPTGSLVLGGGGNSTGGSLVGPLGLIIRGKAASLLARQRIALLTAVTSRANLVTLREFAEAGTLTPVIDRTFPLAAVPDAIRYVETEHARAKVIISVHSA